MFTISKHNIRLFTNNTLSKKEEAKKAPSCEILPKSGLHFRLHFIHAKYDTYIKCLTQQE